jgi:hypothetical protein
VQLAPFARSHNQTLDIRRQSCSKTSPLTDRMALASRVAISCSSLGFRGAVFLNSKLLQVFAGVAEAIRQGTLDGSEHNYTLL